MALHDAKRSGEVSADLRFGQTHGIGKRERANNAWEGRRWPAEHPALAYRAENASGSPATRAQAAAVQVGSIRPALPKLACCGSQHLQLSTPSHLPIRTADLPSRSYRTVARCRRRGVTRG